MLNVAFKLATLVVVNYDEIKRNNTLCHHV